jgi:flagellar hook-basal body complex protein FliE
MTIPIKPTGPTVSPIERGQGISLQPAGNGESFQDMLANAIGDVSRLQATSQDAINAFLRGDPIELHEVMVASEEASISLELLVEMRNKLADAYRTIMNMQA